MKDGISMDDMLVFTGGLGFINGCVNYADFKTAAAYVEALGWGNLVRKIMSYELFLRSTMTACLLTDFLLICRDHGMTLWHICLLSQYIGRAGKILKNIRCRIYYTTETITSTYCWGHLFFSGTPSRALGVSVEIF